MRWANPYTFCRLDAGSVCLCGPLKTINIGMDANGHVNNIPSMQFFTGIFVNTQSKSYILSLTVCVWDFQNNALWETHYHALFNDTMLAFDS